MQGSVIGLGVAALFASSMARGAELLSWQLPLTDAGQAVALGGKVTGGQFGPKGWTTTSREDMIVLPLPKHVNVRHGKLSFSVSNLELGVPGNTMYFEAWELVSLDGHGAPYNGKNGKFGTASLSLLYYGKFTDDAKTKREGIAEGTFNVYDPACAAWQDCTAAARAGAGFIEPGPQVYTFTHEWSLNHDDVELVAPGKKKVESIDYAKLDPDGVFANDAGQMFLMINACGGSTFTWCGPQKGPASMKGGPLGVTYSAVSLVLSTQCGDEVCDAGESCASCPKDCGACDGGAPVCGDEVCDAGESCASCPKDCGACLDGGGGAAGSGGGPGSPRETASGGSGADPPGSDSCGCRAAGAASRPIRAWAGGAAMAAALLAWRSLPRRHRGPGLAMKPKGGAVPRRLV